MADTNTTRAGTAAATKSFKPEPVAERMRIRKGRVMHRVTRTPPAGGAEPDIQSVCRTSRRGRDTGPRARGPQSWWSTERYWYPDCTNCPADEKVTTDE